MSFLTRPGLHHTMVNVFVEWSTALVSHQSLLFLCEQTPDKIDNKIFSQYSTRLIKIKCYTYCKVEFLDRPGFVVSTRKIIHLPYLAQISVIWVTCRVKMMLMSLRHG